MVRPSRRLIPVYKGHTLAGYVRPAEIQTLEPFEDSYIVGLKRLMMLGEERRYYAAKSADLARVLWMGNHPRPRAGSGGQICEDFLPEERGSEREPKPPVGQNPRNPYRRL
jgi:hypothetical protein